MSRGTNDQVKILQFAAFRDHGWGYAAVYPSWPHVLITNHFEPSQNDAIPTIKELSEIF